ncbi:hypothetical protein J7M23_04465, partial [Candidatus Sumerlaeota bacterium]|nr:hypothetical protein [Candidatus Sumerlaeota bacterium]
TLTPTPTPTPIPSPTPTPTITPTPTPTPVAHYDFETTQQGWVFHGQVPGFDVPDSSYESGALGLSPNGSTNCFSYWESPEIQIEDGKWYRSLWMLGSSVSDPDLVPQFRLRVNQKVSWTSWMKVVNSYNQMAPSNTQYKQYELHFDPIVQGNGDEMVVLSFDILSFDPGDDTTSWLYLDEVTVEELTSIP